MYVNRLPSIYSACMQLFSCCTLVPLHKTTWDEQQVPVDEQEARRQVKQEIKHITFVCLALSMFFLAGGSVGDALLPPPGVVLKQHTGGSTNERGVQCGLALKACYVRYNAHR